MAKGKRKKGKNGIDYDSLFETKTPSTGVADMEADQPQQEAAAATAAAVPAETSGQKAEAMDVTEMPATGRGKQKHKGLKMHTVQAATMKVSSRGNRTTKQKQRKADKLDRALSRAGKVATRVDKQQGKTKKKATLKSMY